MKHAKKQTKKAGKPSKAATRKAPKLAVVRDAPAAPTARPRDPRLPAAGTTLVRPYKGKDYRVTVLEDGFRYDGTEYRSLSKLASVISRQPSVNGFLWFRLAEIGRPAPKPRKGKAPAAEPAATETVAVAEPPTA